MPANTPYRTFRALIIDDVHPSLMVILESAGIECSYQPEIHPSKVQEILPSYHILIVRSKIYIDKHLLSTQKNLLIIARAGSGMDNIDMDAAEAAGIVCVNAPEGNRDAVAEQTLAMLLSLLANVHSAYTQVQNFIWDREGNRGYELKGRTVGIIGFGNTGSAVAERLSGFGVRILAYDKYKSGFQSTTVEEVSYEQILSRADVVTFHIPLTTETRAWISRDFINKMGKSFFLLNLSRGGIMKTEEILDGLESGKILGFATDVLEKEPPSASSPAEQQLFQTLMNRPNVLVTPHIGGWTFESYRKISEVLSGKILTAIRELNATNE